MCFFFCCFFVTLSIILLLFKFYSSLFGQHLGTRVQTILIISLKCAEELQWKIFYSFDGKSPIFLCLQHITYIVVIVLRLIKIYKYCQINPFALLLCWDYSRAWHILHTKKDDHAFFWILISTELEIINPTLSMRMICDIVCSSPHVEASVFVSNPHNSHDTACSPLKISPSLIINEAVQL